MEEENRGEYLVIWHALRRYKKSGLVNRIFGKTVEVLTPMVRNYETEEIASYGLNTIKSLGGIEPKIVRIVKS